MKWTTLETADSEVFTENTRYVTPDNELFVIVERYSNARLSSGRWSKVEDDYWVDCSTRDQYETFAADKFYGERRTYQYTRRGYIIRRSSTPFDDTRSVRVFDTLESSTWNDYENTIREWCKCHYSLPSLTSPSYVGMFGEGGALNVGYLTLPEWLEALRGARSNVFFIPVSVGFLTARIDMGTLQHEITGHVATTKELAAWATENVRRVGALD